MAGGVRAGRLVPVLEAFDPGDILQAPAVFVGRGGRVSARVRAFIDFLDANIRLPTLL